MVRCDTQIKLHSENGEALILGHIMGYSDKEGWYNLKMDETPAKSENPGIALQKVLFWEFDKYNDCFVYLSIDPDQVKQANTTKDASLLFCVDGSSQTIRIAGDGLTPGGILLTPGSILGPYPDAVIWDCSLLTNTQRTLICTKNWHCP